MYHYPCFGNLSAEVRDTITYVDKAYAAYEEAKKAAIRAVITEVLGDEWTAKEFNNQGWLAYGVDMPSLETLTNRGYVTYRVEEFELPMKVKEEIAGTRITVTLDNGETFMPDAVYASRFVVGERYGNGYIVKVERDRLPEFKGHRYIYRLA